MSDILYIVMPAYNEEANIISTLDAWYPVIEKHSAGGLSRLVVVNDGSKDRTLALMEDYARTHPLFLPLTKPNGGHGSTVLYAYRYAIAQGADWIFQTDSDGQTDPAEFEQFWLERESHDAVLGNRVVRGDGKDRKFVENTVCLLLRLIFDVRVEDANAPFRLMRSTLVARYIDRLPEHFNIPNIMFTTYFVYYGESVLFLPISFKPRVKGTNSINFKKIVKIGWRAVGDFRKFRREMNDR